MARLLNEYIWKWDKTRFDCFLYHLQLKEDYELINKLFFMELKRLRGEKWKKKK